MNPVRLIELDCARRSTHAACAAFAAASYANDPVFLRQIFANNMVIGVGNNHIVAAIDAQVLWFIETCSERFATVAVEAFVACPGHRADFSVPVHHPQRVPAPFQNVESALRIHRYRSRVHQRRLSRFGAV